MHGHMADDIDIVNGPSHQFTLLVLVVVDHGQPLELLVHSPPDPEDYLLVKYFHLVIPYGSVSYDIKISSIGYKVRCVRGGQINQPFTDNGDGTVTDMVTNLTWQQEDDSIVRTWEEALIYCEGLELLAGQSDWRLPNIKELRSIVDNTTHSPAIDLTYFPDTNLGDYWSSTHGWTYSHHSGAYIPSGAWSISFSIINDVTHDDGYVNKTPTTNNTYARCVRGGQ